MTRVPRDSGSNFAAFPQGFAWGAATSAQQVEGSLLADGAGHSMWHGFARTPGNIASGQLQDVACDHYRRHRDDVALMKRLGLPSYQFSTSWARVMPDGMTVNPAGLDFYDRLVDDLVAAGISPMTVVYTWELPEQLAATGGWLNRDTSHRMAEFAAVLFDRLGDRVDQWLTMCEPMSVAHYGYIEGDLAPGVRDIRAGLRATHHILLGHGLAVERFRSSDATGTIGIINAMADILPGSDQDDDIEAATRAMEYHHALYLDPIVRGQYPESIRSWFEHDWPEVRDGDLATIASPIDFIGIDYYCRSIVVAAPDGSSATATGDEIGAAGPIGSSFSQLLQLATLPPTGRLTSIGWELQPEGLYNVLTWLNRRYPDMPLVITEIGAAYEDTVTPDGKVHDPARTRYLHESVLQAHRAITDGVDLRGCYVWSFLDTWEYNLGYTARFGLVHVDWSTQERTPKASAFWFCETARNNGLSRSISQPC
jgi:beta-glucosidase